MLPEAWLEKVEHHQEALRGLISLYHPSSKQRDPEPMTITAPAAEEACERIRKAIRRDDPQPPVLKFDIALRTKDHATLMRLLNEAWFGVPESRNCWGIYGFSEAVDLLDDPPEVETEEQQ
jgi:hypothetical protein